MIQECKLGGLPSGRGIFICPGPCDLRYRELLLTNNPQHPAAVWKRGENVTIKYQRNNHGPGGFVRFTIVPLDKMLDKVVHEKNAFHYSCWGANPVPAQPHEIPRDSQEYSVSGVDGTPDNVTNPNTTPSYYVQTITIPDVIPDGRYAFGFLWFGGIGGTLEQNQPENPYAFSFFGDYWSCSFIEIKGGNALGVRWKPVFENNMRQKFPNWEEGCYSGNDAPGKCKYEPCLNPGKYEIPLPFKNGMYPPDLSPDSFYTVSDYSGSCVSGICIHRDGYGLPSPEPISVTLKEALRAMYEFRFVKQE